MNLTFCMLY